MYESNTNPRRLHKETCVIRGINQWIFLFCLLTEDIEPLEYKLKAIFGESLCQTYGSCLPLNVKHKQLADVRIVCLLLFTRENPHYFTYMNVDIYFFLNFNINFCFAMVRV